MNAPAGGPRFGRGGAAGNGGGPAGATTGPALRYAYYTGCVPKQSTRELEVAARLVCERLGIGLDEMAGAPCCGAGDIDEIDRRLNNAVNGLTLAQAERTGRDILTICNVCTLNLRQVNKELREDEEERARVNRALAAAGYRYSGGVEVTHLLAVLVSEISAGRFAGAIARPLSGLAIAPFYGCQLLRPSDVTGNQAPDDPRGLETVVQACGGTAVEHEGRLKCCGWPIIIAREATAVTMSAQILASAKQAGADAIVTPCPLCHISLDGYQDQATRLTGEHPGLPVLHLAQLVGLALGLSARELRLHRHLVSTKTLLARLGMSFA